ncbi:MAG: tetratricopeptide repeat protein [Candidatus Obscuribacterales bacterium]
MTEDWRERLKHLEYPAQNQKSADAEPRPQGQTNQNDAQGNLRDAQGSISDLHDNSESLHQSSSDSPSHLNHSRTNPGESRTDLIPPPQTADTGSSSLSFKASRRGAVEAKRQTKDQARPTSTGSFDVAALTERGQQKPPTSEELLKELERFTIAKLLAAHRKQKLLALAAVAGVVLLVIVTIASNSMNAPELTKWCNRACMLAVPLSLVYGLKEGIRWLMKVQPLTAQKLNSLLGWGDPREIAISYIDTADFASAEKVLEKACKKMSAKQAKQYISAYGLLGLIHAYTGRTDAADTIIRQAQELSESNYKARQTDSNAVLLQMSLNYRGEFHQLMGQYESAHRIYLRTLQLICTELNPDGEAIVSALANLGHVKNLMGQHAEALTLLVRAHEIGQELPHVRETMKAFVSSNLGTAYRGIGKLDESEGFFHGAIALAEGPLGQRELGRIYYDLARLYVTGAQHDLGLGFYQKSTAAYDTWKPLVNPEYLRVLQDYAYYLRSIEHNDDADLAKKKAQQMQQNLRDINNMNQGVVQKINASIVESVQAVHKPSRFPIFWTLFFMWECYSVWLSGLRVAPYREWALLITAGAVLALKLKTKYGPPSRNELSQGASMALLSMVPFARSALPELSQMSKTGIATFVVLVVGAFGIVKALSVPPNTVPSGLLPVEYERLADRLIDEENYNLAAKAFDKAVVDASNKTKNSIERTKTCKMPLKAQPDAAIQMNMDALKLRQDKENDLAFQKWNECMTKYPDFEQPAVHVAEEMLKKSKDAKAAEEILNRVLAKNPNYYDALNEMASVKVAEHDSTASMQYTMKAFKALAGEDDNSTQLMEGAFTKLENAEKELKARKATQR